MDDYFVMASECHLIPPMNDISYFPKVKRWWEACDRCGRIALPKAGDLPRKWEAEDLIKDMDDAGIDVGFGLRESMMDVVDMSRPLSTNGWVLEQIAPYPDRLILEANVGPVLRRGVKAANWEMEYLVKERGAKLVKVYQCEDIGPLNDKAMWPFYEKAQELGVPLTIHVGLAYTPPQYTKYVLPIQLDDILIDFPDLKIIAYHMGWPYTEELISMGIKFDNIFFGLSYIIGWYTKSPYTGYQAIGKAIQVVGPDRLVFGLDWPGVRPKPCVEYIKNLDMPDELCEKYGYQKLTREEKQMILGGTLAKLTGVEPTKRIKAKRPQNKK